jgi:hypothetical protein
MTGSIPEGGARYESGTIFVQVVPSFRGVQEAIGRRGRTAAKAFSDEFETGLAASTERVAKKASASVEKELGSAGRRGGEKASKEFGGAFSAGIARALKGAISSIPDIEVGADTSDAQKRLLELRKALQALSDKKVGVGVDTGRALAEIARVGSALGKLSDETADLDIKVDSAFALAELNKIARAVDTVDGKKVKIDVDMDTRRALRAMAGLDQQTKRVQATGDRAANAFRSFNGVLLATAALGPLLIPVLAGIAGGLAAISVAALAGVAALGVLALGFAGVGKAVTALNDQQKNAGREALRASGQMRNAANQVRDAEIALARAREDAAQRAEDAARRVQDAQRRLGEAQQEAARTARDAAEAVEEAQENAADAVERALERQADAERTYQRAQEDAGRAQQALIDARKEAAQDLLNLQQAIRQNQLDERQGVVDLFEAQVRYNNAQTDPGATVKEREEASIALEQARLNLEKIRDEEKRLKEEKAKGDKEGVEGSEKVKNAQEQLLEALENQKEAQEDLRKAAKETDEAREDGAKAVAKALREQVEALAASRRAIADAERDLADARRDQGRAGQDNSRAIEDANRRLTEAQLDYRDALKETGEIGSSSMQKVRDAMNELSPAGQRFARFLHGLRDEFKALKFAAQEGLLPGVQEGIQILLDEYGPELLEFVGTMSKLFGDLFREGAKVLTDPMWQEFFSTIAKYAPGFVRDFFEIGKNLGGVFAELTIAFAPFAKEFSEALVDLSADFLAFIRDFVKSENFQKFLDYLRENGPRILDLLLSLGELFLRIAIGLAPFADMLLTFVQGLLDFMNTIDPKTLGEIAFAILSIVLALQLGAGAVALIAGVLAIVASPIALVIAGIVLLGAALVIAYQRSETFRAIVDKVFKAIGAVASWLWKEILKPFLDYTIWAWTTLAKGIAWVWDNILWPVFKVVGAIVTWLWKEIIWPVLKAVGSFFAETFRLIKKAWDDIGYPVFRLVGAILQSVWDFVIKPILTAFGEGWGVLWGLIKTAWEEVGEPIFNAIKGWLEDMQPIWTALAVAAEQAWKRIQDGVKAPIKFVIDTVINPIIIDNFNKLADFFGTPKIKRLESPKFAKGGVLPGYTPGRDVHKFYSRTGGQLDLSGGEAIMVPQWTRAFGHKGIEQMNALARRYGPKAIAEMFGIKQAFAKGGVFWPVATPNIGARFGQRGGGWSSGYHTGQDFPEALGTSAYAIATGQVKSAGWSSWGGNLLKMSHGKGIESWYAHLAAFIAKAGQLLKGGQELGLIGSTGNSTGSHLHLEVRQNGKPIDPLAFIKGGGAAGGGIGEKIGDFFEGVTGWMKEAITGPANWVKKTVQGAVDKVYEKLGESPWVKAVAALPKKFIDGFVGKIKEMAGDIGEFLGGGGGSAPKGELQKMVAAMAKAKYGWEGAQWNALQQLVAHESSWNPNAQNPNSSAYGLFQFLNSTWASVGGRKTSDPRLQAEYGLKYIADRYGNPGNAWSFWNSQDPHWYHGGGVWSGPTKGGDGAESQPLLFDTGGMLPPGLSAVLNLTGRPEPVFSDQQWKQIRDSGFAGGWIPRGRQVGDINIPMTLISKSDPVEAAQAAASAMNFEARRIRRGGRYAGYIGSGGESGGAG